MNEFINEYTMLKSLSDFMHYSKGIDTPLRHKLINKINEFLSENQLNTDPHDFVDLSKLKNDPQ